MKLTEKAKLLASLIAYKATMNRRNLDSVPKLSQPDPSPFLSAREAARRIPKGATVISTGMAGHSRCSIFYWAICDAWKSGHHQGDLTWITVSALGGRGKVPGTIEELGHDGLVTEYITGHLETAKAMLALGEKQKIHLHTMPQGEITELLVAQSQGKKQITTPTGIGTFLDPERGGGTAVTPHTTTNYMKRNGKNLSYTLPPIDVALFTAPYADAEGNIYFHDAAVITESKEAAMAAHANGGKVMVAVSRIIEKDPSRIGLLAKYVSHIVVNPWNEQTTVVRQRRFWPMFTQGARVDVKKAVETLKFINNLVKFTPARTPVDNALARLAALQFVREAPQGALVNLGIGMPEEVGRLIYEGGVHGNYTFSAETGVMGGLPTPGIYFGGSINPEKIETSPWIFNHYKENLDVTVLGTLQVDGSGNVNVSKRGDRVVDYVGPGGFMNISSAAKTIIFVGSWMAKADFQIRDGEMCLIKPGIAKFVKELNEVTFNAKAALQNGKNVSYITTVGIFKLTPHGVMLTAVMPGIDIQRDILPHTTAEILISDHVETIPKAITTGEGYTEYFRETLDQKQGQSMGKLAS